MMPTDPPSITDHAASPLRSLAGPLAWVTPAALCASVTVAWALSSPGTGDYLTHGGVGGDNPAPAIDALVHGHLAALAARQPLMGLTSILLRLPFAALGSIIGGGNTLVYALGAVACIAPAGLLAVWLVRTRRDAGSWLGPAVAGAVLLASPAALSAIQSGHPEETLASVLATVAVLAAIDDRATAAGLLLGAAIGCKQWALIASLPVLIALSERRLQTALVAAGLATVLNGLLPVADPDAFRHASRLVGAGHIANTVSAWWPFAHPIPTPRGAPVAPTARILPLGLTRSSALALALGSVIAASAAEAMRRRARGSRIEPLALLALLGLVRCVMDSGNQHYYFVALLVPLAVLETVTLRRAPVMAVLAAALAELTFSLRVGPAEINGILLAWTAGIGACLLHVTFRTAVPDLGPLARAEIHVPTLGARLKPHSRRPDD